MNPTLDAVDGTRQAASDLNRLLEISVQRAGDGVRKDLEDSKTPRPILSPVEVLLQPFNDVLLPAKPSKPAESDVVRF
jgi:hypothetical protein